MAERQQLGNGRFLAKLSLVRTPRIEIARAAWSPGLLMRGNVIPGYTGLVAPTDKSQGTYFCAAPLRHGSIAFIRERDEVDYRTVGNHELINVAVENETLNRHVAGTLKQPLADFAHDRRLFCSPETMSGVLVPTFSSMISTVLMRPAILKHERSTLYLEKLILDAVTAAIDPPDRRVSGSGRQQIARLAESYMREQVTELVTVGELCELTGASKRTLHLAFLESFGMSPKQMLKAMRLNLARRDLCNPTATTTVTDVAMHWGFFHLGRFSIGYREMFGETPVETLRRQGYDPADEGARFSM